MSQQVVLVLDCGSTNITAVAVDTGGRPVASASEPNGPAAQVGGREGWLVWDMDRLWKALSSLSRRVCSEVGGRNVRAVTITTWGADGAPVAADGALTYPPIAWECPRTSALSGQVSKAEARRLYDITGYQVISFNTLFKLKWLRENAPEALERADKWMMMPGLLSYRLCGEMSMDATSASTMMVMDLRASNEMPREPRCASGPRRNPKGRGVFGWMPVSRGLGASDPLCADAHAPWPAAKPTPSRPRGIPLEAPREAMWSAELLGAVGLDESFFPPLLYPGAVIGRVSSAASQDTAIPEGTPVIAAGHDTQFAPIGSGARPDEAVLSSGTWEILMLRTGEFKPNYVGFSEGLLTELDAVRGLYNPQLLMMGSGVLEWVRETLYGDVGDRAEVYGTMIEEASRLKPGAGGVMMVPSFVPDAGPTKKHHTRGTVVGLGLASTRAHVYRAALEGLAFQLRDALRILTAATGFEPAGIRVVGGGSRNELWNQIRADACGIPVSVTGHKEATVLGAAIAAWVGAGRFESLQQGQRSLATETIVIEPSEDADAYGELFERYVLLAPALKDFYST